MRRNSAAGLLPDVNVPVLILAGGKDNFTPVALQQHLHDVLPDSELVVFENGHHTLPLEEPEGINEAVGRFLDKVAAKSPVAG
jgi:pimeloyl-ACP methyl ester carboxylesterase